MRTAVLASALLLGGPSRPSRCRPSAAAGEAEGGGGRCAQVYPLIPDGAGTGGGIDEPAVTADGGFLVLRTLPGGDSLYHATALAMRYAELGEVNSMFWPLLPQLTISLRERVVELLGERGRLLHLGAGATIASADLVEMAAARRLGSAASEAGYLKSVYELGEHSGGAELVALVNELRRPARVYEPRLAADGTVGLARVVCVGAPAFGNASAMHLLALDSLDWGCDDDARGIVRAPPGAARDDRGVAFHALLPARAAAPRAAPAEAGGGGAALTDAGAERMRARVASSPEALDAIRQAAQDPAFAAAVAEVARDPSRAAHYAKDPQMARMLALVLGKLRDGWE